MTKLIVAATGHRFKTLGGPREQVKDRLYTVAYRWLDGSKHRIDYVISGMALGWDQSVASACVNLNIPWVAYVPFQGQEDRWPEYDKAYYTRLLTKAREVIVVSDGGYTSFKMQKRNVAMVDACSLVLALWNGAALGGTYNCIRYAEVMRRPVINLWSRFVGQP